MSLAILAEKIADSFDFFVKEILCASPSEDQQQFINAVQKAINGEGRPAISVRSGHGTGKTACLAWLILWIGLTRKDAKIPTTAPVSAQLTNLLIPEVRKWAGKTKEIAELVEVQTQDVKFFNGNHCFARTARKENTEALAGVHAQFVCYIADEASGIDQAVFDVIEGALTGDNYIFVMTSNPTRNTGTFYDSHNKKRSHYQILHFDSEKSTNVNSKWVKDMEDKYGRDSDVFNVRVKGNFPKQNSGGLFELDKLEASMTNEYSKNIESGVSVMAVDVARFGEDSSVLAYRRGLAVKKLDIKRKLSTTDVTNWIAYKFREYRPDVCFIDTTGGHGTGPYDQCLQLKLDVMPAEYSSTADNPMFHNKRAEMYFNLKEAINNGAVLPKDEELMEELLAITYEFTPQGKIKLVPKEEIKKSIGRSPDKADAVAMLFFTSVAIDVNIDRYYEDDYVAPNLY